MAITVGDRIGPYEVLSLIGEGGMGRVYRASDTRLRRDVALKVLPEVFAGDADRLVRFEREAHVLASLNHPNIAAIYGLEGGEDRSAPALVLELVDGPTLAERLAAGPLAVADALPIAVQIAEALETAHEAGIVHRDLKPANSKLRPDGAVKVLDFGLAKALLPETAGAAASLASRSPTITSPAMTRAGIILGTAAYVSPEQARGDFVDQRSDVWAFGCVLFEMLTGRRAFEGATISDTLAAVLRAEPEWDRLPSDLHPRIRLLLERCLDKNVRLRYQGIGDARADIVRALAHPGEAPAGSAAPRPRRGAWPWVALSAVVGALVAGVAAWTLRPSSEIAGARLTHVLPDGVRFTETGRPHLAVAPDGTSIVYVAANRLFRRPVDELEATAIRGTDGRVSTPVISPDGRSVVYWDAADEGLKRIDITGGTPVVLDRAVNVRGASWAPDGTIYYGKQDGIWSVNAAGGPARKIVPIETGWIHGPQLLPGGRRLLFTRLLAERGTSWEGAQVVVRDLDSGQDTVIVTGEDGRYVPTGHLLYAIDTTLFAAPFDAEAGRVTGAAVPVIEGVRRETWVAGNTATANYDVSANGVLVYVHGDRIRLPVIARDLVLVDLNGNSRPLTDERRDYWRPVFSPDGTRVVVEVFDGKARHLQIVSLDTGTSTQVTYTGRSNDFAVWTPDGKSLIFLVTGEDGRRVVRQPVDGGAGEVLPLSGDVVPTDVTRDGTLVFSLGDQTAQRAIWILPPGAPRPTEIVATPTQEHHAMVSPDGKWLAYASNTSGPFEVYVRPYPIVPGTERRVSEGGGNGPVWAPDGSVLYYRGPDAVMVVPTPLGPGFLPGRPRALFDGNRYRFSGNAAAFDIHPDGKRFVMVTLGDPPPPLREQVNVVFDWFDELKRRVR
jgi:Tol biopolymer transport system component